MPPDESSGAAAPTSAPAPAATPTPAPAGTPPAPATPPAPGAPPATPPASALEAGKPAPGAAPPATPPSFDYIPEKYRTNGADGKLDLEASSKKMAEAHGHLEQRLGRGDVPPKSADEYKVNIPEEFKDLQIDVEAMKIDPAYAAMLKEMHATGASQQAIDAATKFGIQIARTSEGGIAELDAGSCVEEVTGNWKDTGGFDANIKRAYGAAQHFGADGDFDKLMAGPYKNDPLILRILARVGKDMGEDTALVDPAAVQLEQAGIEGLMRTEAYRNANHPEHAATVKKVTGFFEKTYGNKPKAAGSFVMETVRP